MRELGCAFVDTIKHLMQLLLEYRAVIKEENVDNKMSCTVSLLVGNIQQSVSIQYSTGNTIQQ